MTTIVFIGGDERQRRAAGGVSLPTDTEVVWIQPCWTRNWNKTAAKVRRAIDGADAIAMSHDVPTLLGREVRRLAGRNRVPWVAGRARGGGSIRALIEDACDLAGKDRRSA